MKITLAESSRPVDKNTATFIPFFEGSKLSLKNGVIEKFLKDDPKFGKLFEQAPFYSQEEQTTLIGAGKKEKFDLQKLQNLVGAAVKSSLSKFNKIAIKLPHSDQMSDKEIVNQAVIGVEIAAFDSSKEFKSDKEPVKLAEVSLIVEKISKETKDGLAKGQLTAEAVNLTRKLGDMPSNIMTPAYFLNTAKKLARDNKLKITVLDEKASQAKGMGAFIGVAQGSEEPSFMIALEYAGDPKSKNKWGLIGKGITFDSGGISIKPAESMHEMKYDMMGAATVLSTITLASQLKLKVNIVGVMAVTENLPGGRAQRPGDIVRTYSGKTAEVLNTDAEGRLVLSDAITFAQKDFKATKMIDLATLTGAIIVSLGDFITGVFDNNAKFATELISTGASVGEKFWEMPMDEEYDEMIKSDIADITNIGHSGSMGSRTAGSITAAKFLEQFVEKNNPWIHLDIAGTAWDMKPRPFRGPGATGVGIKTLIKLLEKE